MRVTLTDEQEFLREAVRGAIDRSAPLSAVRSWALDGAGGDPGAVLADQGWLGIGIDERLGGEGGGVVERMILAEELGRGSVPDTAAWSAVPAAIALATASGAPVDPAQVALLADLRRPLDEPTAVEVDGERVSAEVDFAADPGEAERLVLLTADPAGGALVRAVDAAHATSRPRPLVDRTRRLARVRLDGAPSTTVGTLAADALERLAATSAVLVAADALGAAQWLLDETVSYVKDRHQFGVPVGSFQAVKHAAAQMLVPIEATRSAVQYAAWALDEGEPDALQHAWLAKAYAADQLADVADKALFLHGAIGYTWEHDLQLPFKRIKSDARLLGPAALYHDRVAATLRLVAA